MYPVFVLSAPMDGDLWGLPWPIRRQVLRGFFLGSSSGKVSCSFSVVFDFPLYMELFRDGTLGEQYGSYFSS